MSGTLLTRPLWSQIPITRAFPAICALFFPCQFGSRRRISRPSSTKRCTAHFSSDGRNGLNHGQGRTTSSGHTRFQLLRPLRRGGRVFSCWSNMAPAKMRMISNLNFRTINIYFYYAMFFRTASPERRLPDGLKTVVGGGGFEGMTQVWSMVRYSGCSVRCQELFSCCRKIYSNPISHPISISHSAQSHGGGKRGNCRQPEG